MIENIPDLGTQSDISELLVERRKLTLEYFTISNNFRNFSVILLKGKTCEWYRYEIEEKIKYSSKRKDKKITSGIILGSLIAHCIKVR